MKLLYATSNNSKIYNMRRRLKDLPIELITPSDLGLNLEIEEDGSTVIENALKKARAYYNITKIPTIAGDSEIHINNLPKDKQPGLYVRRKNNKKMSDNEMIIYYQNLINSIGGITTGYCTTGLALINEEQENTIKIKEDEFILTSNVSKEYHRGDPFNALSISPITNKYYSEMTDQEFIKLNLKFDKETVEFISKNLLN